MSSSGGCTALSALQPTHLKGGMSSHDAAVAGRELTPWQASSRPSDNLVSPSNTPLLAAAANMITRRHHARMQDSYREWHLRFGGDDVRRVCSDEVEEGVKRLPAHGGHNVSEMDKLLEPKL